MDWKVILEAQKLNEAVSAAVLIVVGAFLETFGLGDYIEYGVESEVKKPTLQRLARSLGLGVSGTVATLLNRLNSSRILRVAPTNPKGHSLHPSAKVGATGHSKAKGSLSNNRVVREAPYMAEATTYRDMNRLRGVDSGLHPEERDACPRCGRTVTIPNNTTICRICGLDTAGMHCEKVLRPTTKNHTESGYFPVICKNEGKWAAEQPHMATVASVQFQKNRDPRVKCGGAKNYFHVTPVMAIVDNSLANNLDLGVDDEMMCWVFVDNRILREGGFC
jgi:hypothetical protein